MTERIKNGETIEQGRGHQLSGGAVDTIMRGMVREACRTRRVWKASPPGKICFL